MKFLIPLLAVACLFSFPSLCFAELKVEADKENVVASRLEGSWRKDAALTERLTVRKPKEESDKPAISFKSDPTIAGKIPEKFEPFLKDKKIFMAGICTFHGDMKNVEHPFILIEIHGNPHVVWFRERDGDPLGDEESNKVMLAVANDTANDLLFMSGDLNIRPFSAFSRVKPEAAK